MPFGSSSARVIVRVAGETGWSRKRSRAAGAGAAMSIRKPSTTLPFVTVWLDAVGQARQLVAAGRQRRIGDELVVARLQLLAVDDGDRDARDADAAAVDVRRHRHAAGHRVASTRPRPTRRRPRAAARRRRPAAEVEAERLLRVEGAGDRRGHLADQAARIGEVVVLQPQQAGDRAAGDEAVGEGARGRAFLDADLHLARVVAGRRRS